MIERKEAREIKTCYATFYQSDIIRLLLGDVLHPDGLKLTGYLGTVVGLGSEDKVLDIACGLETVNNARRSLLSIELAIGIRKLELGDLDLAKAKSLAERANKLIDRGVIGYTLFKANKEDR